jgi:hypothetical protein
MNKPVQPGASSQRENTLMGFSAKQLQALRLGLALKVSDEFTVPLSRGHHRQLHQTGDEVMKSHGGRIAVSMRSRSREDYGSKRIQIL